MAIRMIGTMARASRSTEPRVPSGHRLFMCGNVLQGPSAGLDGEDLSPVGRLQAGGAAHG